MNPDDIRALFAYNDWANDRVVPALHRLSPADLTRPLGSSFPSVLATFAHMASAEWVWLERWQGRSPTSAPSWVDQGGLDDVSAALRETRRARSAALAGVTAEELGRIVTYRNLRGDVTWTLPVGAMLRHVVNHSTYHRGQLATLLRQLGTTPPSTDYLIFATTPAP